MLFNFNPLLFKFIPSIILDIVCKKTNKQTNIQ